MQYKILKRKIDINQFKNFVQQNNFILIFDIESNSMKSFRAYLENNNVNFMKINSSHLNFVKPYNDFHNLLKGETMMISLDTIEEKLRKRFVSNLIDNSRQGSFLKAVVLENKIFRSASIEFLLSINSKITNDLTRLLFFSVKRFNYALSSLKK